MNLPYEVGQTDFENDKCILQGMRGRNGASPAANADALRACNIFGASCTAFDLG